jgi:hypothetical protein
MTIRVIREPSIEGATLSVWFVNGHFECFGLEDQIREQQGQPVENWKVAGRSAIPSGAYQVTITDSVRFKRRLPLLLAVPGFEGVRIHPGNTIHDTEGCLLPGRLRAANRVGESRLAFERLFKRLELAAAIADPIELRIENPEP